ncbi:GNAT family N-acetyltransferase [Hazenella sp. IB182353]|nr:GNAT family N-acetyltransferase [Polycladospora coralii]
MDINLIQLAHYKPEYRTVLNNFDLPKEQLQFTALPKDALHTCSHEVHRFPIVILHETIPVGFFVLNTGRDIQKYTLNLKAIFVRALSINYADQGKGYAEAGMKKLPQFVSQYFPSFTEILLVVNDKNEPARRLYLKAGFTDTGRKSEGPIGRQSIFSYAL